MNYLEKIKAQALLSEVEQQRNLLGSRAAEIAAEAAVEIARLRARVSELEALLQIRPDLKVVP